jgi:hypothetical protein
MEKSMKFQISLASNPLLPRDGLVDDLRQNIDLLSDVLYGPRAHVKARNEKFVAHEIERNKAFFDTVEKTPLAREQRVASIVMEDRNLLVAAAGSGKTSTVVGKIERSATLSEQRTLPQTTSWCWRSTKPRRLSWMSGLTISSGSFFRLTNV